MLQGIVDRSDVYKGVEQSLETLISQNISQLEAVVREIRRADVGEEAARQEEIRGRKSDDEYAEEAARRQEERAKAREQEEKKKKREEEKEALKAEAAKKMRELEKLRSQDERRKEREARKAAILKDRAEQKEKYEQRRQEYEREKEKEEEQKYEHDDPGDPVEPPAAELPTEQELEEAALERLLREGAELAAKNNKKELDPLEETAPPHRQGSALIPKGPAADRYKLGGKPEHPGPKLSYSSTHRGVPHIPSVKPPIPQDDNRSPFRHSFHQERRPSVSQHEASSGHRDRASASWAASPTDPEDSNQVYKQRQGADYEDDLPSSSHRGDSIRDDRHRHHEHEDDRDQEYYRRKERDRGTSSRYRDDVEVDDDHDDHHRHRRSGYYGSNGNPKSREYFDEHTGRPRARIDDPPDNIDRYVPGKGTVSSSRNRDRESEKDYGRESYLSHRHRDREGHRSGGYEERDRDRDRDRDRVRERGRDHVRESSSRDIDRDRDREVYYRDRERERDRERDEYRERERERDEYRSSKKDYEKDRERDRDWEKEYERSSHSHRSRRDPVPEKIDRYVPGA